MSDDTLDLVKIFLWTLAFTVGIPIVFLFDHPEINFWTILADLILIPVWLGNLVGLFISTAALLGVGD